MVSPLKRAVPSLGELTTSRIQITARPIAIFTGSELKGPTLVNKALVMCVIAVPDSQGPATWMPWHRLALPHNKDKDKVDTRQKTE